MPHVWRRVDPPDRVGPAVDPLLPALPALADLTSTPIPTRHRPGELRTLTVVSLYPPLDVCVATPRLELRGATDALLEQVAPLVRAGGAMADPPPWDDPSSFYEADPDARVQGWLRGIWRGRAAAGPDRWRLHFVVVVDDRAVGMQDLTGERFGALLSVETTSWISADGRGKGIGTEARSAILHLAFAGLGADEANSEAAVDNAGSNGVSRHLGYEPNGTSWATHQGRPVIGQRWRLERSAWETERRTDIELTGVGPCRVALGLPA